MGHPSTTSHSSSVATLPNESLLRALANDHILTIESAKPEKKSATTHAEMHILAHIVALLDAQQKLPSTLYIGISKLCCFSCRLMLQAANKVFAAQGIGLTLEFRG